MRLAIGGALLARCLADWPPEVFPLAALCGAEGLAAVLLLAGLGTPICGTGAAAVELWWAYSDSAGVPAHLLLATLGAALTLLGPGAFSVDAWVFGWRPIDVPSKDSADDSD